MSAKNQNLNLIRILDLTSNLQEKPGGKGTSCLTTPLKCKQQNADGEEFFKTNNPVFFLTSKSQGEENRSKETLNTYKLIAIYRPYFDTDSNKQITFKII